MPTEPPPHHPLTAPAPQARRRPKAAAVRPDRPREAQIEPARARPPLDASRPPPPPPVSTACHAGPETTSPRRARRHAVAAPPGRRLSARRGNTGARPPLPSAFGSRAPPPPPVPAAAAARGGGCVGGGWPRVWALRSRPRARATRERVFQAARMLSAALKLVSDLSACICFRPEHHQSSSLVPTMSAVAHSLSQLQSRVGDADKGTAKKA